MAIPDTPYYYTSRGIGTQHIKNHMPMEEKKEVNDA
jgi:hypothetical protein